MLSYFVWYYKNYLKFEIYTHVYKSPVIRGNIEGDLSFLVIPLPPPNFAQLRYGVIGLIIVTVEPR